MTNSTAFTKTRRIRRIGYIAATLLVVTVSTTESQSQGSTEAERNKSASRKPPGWFAAGPSAPGIWANIAAHPSGTIYIASMGGGVRKSADFGETWATVNNSLPAGANSFAMDAAGPDTIYCGVLSVAAGAPGGVYKSTDGGATWVHTSGSTNIVAISLEADPTNPVVVFMGALIDPTQTSVLYAASEGGGGVYKSKDGGANWTQVNLNLADTSVFGLVMDPFRPKTLYVSTPSGVYKTLSGGD